MEQQHEMNLFDFCKAISRGIVRAVMWIVNRIGDMIRLTYRQWWIVAIVVVLAVAWSLYYSRPSNRMYEAKAIATLNGVTNEMVRHEFEALGKTNIHFTEQTTAKMMNIDAELAWRLSHFHAFDVIDLLADSTVDMVDYHHNISRTDTLAVHMPNRVALRFRTQEPNRLMETETAILDYLNSRPYFQALYQQYAAQKEREARFHASQIEKLDSLSTLFYFSQNAGNQVQLNMWEEGTILGRREIALFLEDVYTEMQVNENAQLQWAVCTAPVVLQSHFILDPCAVNRPLRMVAMAVLLGWLVGLLIAALVEYRKQICAWLRQ